MAHVTNKITHQEVVDDKPEQRALRIKAAIHSAEIEGLDVTEGTRTDADSHVAGEIDSTELVDRVRARYGLT